MRNSDLKSVCAEGFHTLSDSALELHLEFLRGLELVFLLDLWKILQIKIEPGIHALWFLKNCISKLPHFVGVEVGSSVGDGVGNFVGDSEGNVVGNFVGKVVGVEDGDLEGLMVGLILGWLVGIFDGVLVGMWDGELWK